MAHITVFLLVCAVVACVLTNPAPPRRPAPEKTEVKYLDPRDRYRETIIVKKMHVRGYPYLYSLWPIPRQARPDFGSDEFYLRKQLEYFDKIG